MPHTAIPLLLALLLQVPWFAPQTLAQPPAPKDFQAHAQRVQQDYESARARWMKESNSVEAAWRFGRATFDWAEFATNNTLRARLAEEGIVACRAALARESNSVASHYYLALNLGQLARTKLLGALRLIDEMEREWTIAIRLDPSFDFAGPHRSLGILYRDAPGWPTSVGSEKKSREHLQKAVELHPGYPGNRLALFEGYVEWGDKRLVRAQADQMESVLKSARAHLTGDAWALDWEDWHQRWAAVKEKVGLSEK